MTKISATHTEEMRHVSLEAIDNRSRVEEKSADIGRCNICPGSTKRYTVPSNELIFPPVEVVVLGSFNR